MPLTTFLFDLDGTLIDSIELILRSYRHTMQVHRANAPLPPDDVWMKGLGTPLWVQFRHWTDDEAEIEAMVATYRAYNLTHHDALVKPYEGVVTEVLKLHERGKRLALVTSKLRVAQSCFWSPGDSTSSTLTAPSPPCDAPRRPVSIGPCSIRSSRKYGRAAPTA